MGALSAPADAGQRLDARRWSLNFYAGALPVLLLGFAASVAADRLLFAAWGLASALVYGLALRWGWSARRAWPARVALAAGGVLFVWLAARHRADLQLGLAALLPAREAAP
jgi:hypothetical protein